MLTKTDLLAGDSEAKVESKQESRISARMRRREKRMRFQPKNILLKDGSWFLFIAYYADNLISKNNVIAVFRNCKLVSVKLISWQVAC